MTRSVKLAVASILAGVLMLAGSLLTQQKIAASPERVRSLSPMTVVASTSNPYDTLHYCFYRVLASNLYFNVTADQSVSKVELTLWSINDPTNPSKIFNGSSAVSAGQTKIIVPGDGTHPPHLGPGPYIATLEATQGAAAVKPSSPGSYFLYYYETRDKGSNCKLMDH